MQFLGPAIKNLQSTSSYLNIIFYRASSDMGLNSSEITNYA